MINHYQKSTMCRGKCHIFRHHLCHLLLRCSGCPWSSLQWTCLRCSTESWPDRVRGNRCSSAADPAQKGEDTKENPSAKQKFVEFCTWHIIYIKKICVSCEFSTYTMMKISYKMSMLLPECFWILVLLCNGCCHMQICSFTPKAILLEQGAVRQREQMLRKI